MSRNNQQINYRTNRTQRLRLQGNLIKHTQRIWDENIAKNININIYITFFADLGVKSEHQTATILPNQ